MVNHRSVSTDEVYNGLTCFFRPFLRRTTDSQLAVVSHFITEDEMPSSHDVHKWLSDDQLEARLLPEALPRHIAIIMDGNGRWAARRGLPRIAGHRQGAGAAQEAVRACLALGIPALTLYAFSLENWKRPQEEVGQLMDLFVEFFHSHVEALLRERIRIRAIGQLDRLPLVVQQLVRHVEECSREYDRLTVSVALSYSGRAEILDAVNKIARDAARDGDGFTPLSEERFGQYLSMPDMPDPDLLIRTSGESRISNFLLWQIAYAELYFTPVLWPDFRRRDLLLALLDYQARERRLGGIRPERPARAGETCALAERCNGHASDPADGATALIASGPS